MKYDLLGIFPTAIGVFSEVPITKKDTKTLLNINDYIDNIGNLTSDEDCVLEKTPSLKRTIEKCIKQFVSQTYHPINDIEFPITQSWLNKTKKGMFHHVHTHSNSYISGVLYLKTIPNDKINFDTTDLFSVIFDIEEYNAFNSQRRWVNLNNYDLLLFPSSLAHSVSTNETEEDRISLSFNTWVEGTVGVVRKKIGVISKGGFISRGVHTPQEVTDER